MKKIILIVVLAALGWYGYGKYVEHAKADRAAARATAKGLPASSSGAGDQGVNFFTCDGRNTCIQMTSCEEAKYFIKNCPGMSQEASGESSSCEQQWCK